MREESRSTNENKRDATKWHHHSHENKQESKEGEVGVGNDVVETW
jgi:hypothetical protein